MREAVIMLQQFIGTLLQTVPVAVILGIAFDETEMRGRKQTYYMGAIGFLVVGGGIFALAFMQKESDMSYKLFGDILMLFIILLFCIFYFYFLKASFIKKVIVLGMGCNYAAIVFLLNSLFMKCMFGSNPTGRFEQPYIPANLFGLVVLTAVTYPPIFVFVNRIVKKNIQEMDHQILRKQCFFVLVNLILFCIESFLLPFGDTAVAAGMIAAMIGNTVIVYYLFFGELRLMKEQFLLVEQLNNFKIQSQSIGKNIEEMRRMNHNIRHHLNVIGVLNEEGKKEEITEYLKSYENHYVMMENEKLSGYAVLDSILRYYFQKMRLEQVELSTKFQIGSHYEFEPLDITILFGNCLENALEESKRLPVEARSLELDIRVSGETFMIALKNRCVGGKSVNNGEFTDWKQFLSEKRKNEMGEGLHSIDIVVKKYGGNVRFKRDETHFVMHAFLRIP